MVRTVRPVITPKVRNLPRAPTLRRREFKPRKASDGVQHRHLKASSASSTKCSETQVLPKELPGQCDSGSNRTVRIR
jgi:hypothetical protein